MTATVGSVAAARSRSYGQLENDTCRQYVLPALSAAGWQPEAIVEQRYFTDGRIVRAGAIHVRQRGKRTDYLLEARPGLACAVVEAKRFYKLPADGLQQAIRYAEILDLPLAYATNGVGIVEFDRSTGLTTTRSKFPSPDDVWSAYVAWKGLTPASAAVVAQPFNRRLRNGDGSVKEPRYFQKIAINRAVQAIQDGEQRALLTMATGTGKTFTALQIVAKLLDSDWKDSEPARVLYLADRKVLVDQPISREFRPVFGDAVWRLRGQKSTSRQIYFALYQNLLGGGAESLLRDYPANFFDLVVVDECHRGSARDESAWREVLEHFKSAAQLGLTATPLRHDNTNTYRYFGAPLYEYSLAQGIEDGFLAPYDLRRIHLSTDISGWEPAPGERDRLGRLIPEGTYTTPQYERIVSLLMRTRAAARHLTEYLRRTDRMAKTIIFCVDSEHAEQMRMELANMNADLVRENNDWAVRIVSDEGDVGAEHLDNFMDPEQMAPVVATTSKLLSTGVDIPTCRNIVLFKPIGSIVEFKQIIGRGTRLHADSHKMSFTILDYSGASSLFEDKEFDGYPEALTEEKVDDDGHVTERREREVPDSSLEDVDRPPGDGGDTGVVEDRDEDEGEDGGPRTRQKYYVDRGSVEVVDEIVRVLDPTTGELREISYTEHVRAVTLSLAQASSELLERWADSATRTEMTQRAAELGVDIVGVAARAGRPELDPVDALVELVWSVPPVTRRERADRVLSQPDLFAGLSPVAQIVVRGLLEKYAAFGVDQLSNLRTLEVPPLQDFGTPLEIARAFGGPAALRDKVRELQRRLYVEDDR